MNIKFDNMKDKMPEITGLLFTHPIKQDYGASEIWIKYRNNGVYVFINFEQPLPQKIELQKLVGEGNSLNCSDYKKDNELIQYNEKSEVIEILTNSVNFRANVPDTVEKVKELFILFPNRF